MQPHSSGALNFYCFIFVFNIILYFLLFFVLLPIDNFSHIIYTLERKLYVTDGFLWGTTGEHKVIRRPSGQSPQEVEIAFFDGRNSYGIL